MTTAVAAGLAGCLDGIARPFVELFATMDRWRQALAAAAWADGPTAGVLDRCCRELVTADLMRVGSIVSGAGFVARPGWVTDAHWHLAWWQGPSASRLVADLEPTSASFRDYTGLEWWRVPARTGEPHITGPYVDYLCTDDYTLTLTAPVHRDGDLLGVVGVDIYVRTIEPIVLAQLNRLGSTAGARGGTVVNGGGRVIASTDPHRAAGSLLRLDAVTDRTHECPGTSLRLVLDEG
jgi:hypothetical protein